MNRITGHIKQDALILKCSLGSGGEQEVLAVPHHSAVCSHYLFHPYPGFVSYELIGLSAYVPPLDHLKILLR